VNDVMPAANDDTVTTGIGLIPRATYRLQLNAQFTFQHATAIVPYLASLGISHVYCSPYFRARAGSMHGYDVVDHNAFNPEIGTREDFEAFVDALRAHGMGHILDIVPNHVGIGSDNAWWMDVLENGPASAYAQFFDIDWQPANPTLAGKVLVPVLGEAYGIVLEKGELQLKFDAGTGTFAVFYHEHRFPVDPRTYPYILDRVNVADAWRQEFDAVRTAFGKLPACEDCTADLINQRHRDKQLLKELLQALCDHQPAVVTAIEEALHTLAGNESDPASFDLLHTLIEAQAYRLAYWRVASDEINYRRFFDVNELAALRMEVPEVFEATHRFLLELIREGKVDGLRVDHPDGLHDPAGYFQHLQEHIAAARGVPFKSGSLPFYLVVEKITAGFEKLPATWPVHGTSGYRFVNVVNGLFVDGASKGRMDRVYRTFIGEPVSWPQMAYDAKRLILETSLSAELNTLTNRLVRIARADRRTQDFTFNNLHLGLIEVIACFPVYRTYVVDEVSSEDRRFIEWAMAGARRRGSGIDSLVFDFIRLVLLGELPATTDSMRRRIRAFAMRFQQVTAPVTAKGVEDTALYRFHRLVSLNEVGGEPETFGISVRAFHADAQARVREWPQEMLATSTHDTKRSEDVRARIDVLSEIPALWRQMIVRWQRMNRTRKREIEGKPAPGPNQEYLFYQILLGSWPIEELDDAALTAYRERVEAYMVKASREAKTRTSWSDISADYEDALVNFVRVTLERREGNLFLDDLISTQKRLLRFGLLNSLSQVVAKLTAPGMPDIYQGNETWDFSLVDPDNRRAVDYDKRRAMVQEFAAPAEDSAAYARELLNSLEDGRAKAFVTWKTLQFRRTHEGLFRDGGYTPSRVFGAQAAFLCAYVRKCGQEMVLVVIPRLFIRLLHSRELLPVGEEVWANTFIELPKGFPEAPLENIFDGAPISIVQHEGKRCIRVGDALAHFSVALLQSKPG